MTPFDSRRLLPSEDLTGETWVVNPACELGSPYPRSGAMRVIRGAPYVAIIR